MAVFSNNKFQIIDQSKGLISDYSKKVFEDKRRNIWFTSPYGFSIITPDSIINYSVYNDEPIGEIYATYVALDSSVWLSSYERVFKFDNVLTEFRHDALEDAVVREISEDRMNSYWFGTQGNGVVNITNTDVVIFNSQTELRSDYVFAIESLGEGSVIVGTG